jgi:maleate isomerase
MNNKILFDSAPQLTIGFIQIAGDINLEMEVGGLLSQIDGVCWRMQKIPFTNDKLTVKTYNDPACEIPRAVRVFLPKNGRYGNIDVFAFACTSMSIAVGTDLINDLLKEGCCKNRDDIVVINMADAIVEAIGVVSGGYNRICLLTPYIDELHQKTKSFLESCGIKIEKNWNLGLETDSDISSVNPEWLAEYIEELVEKMKKKPEVFVICCSAMRVCGYGYISKLEKRFGVRVITSNQALMWYCLVKGGISKDELVKIHGYGSLFSGV